MAFTARLAGAGIICLVALTTPIQAATPIGKVYSKSGSPSASGPGGNRNLDAGSAVYEDDKIVTGGGNVQVVFVDETKLVVGPNSTLVVDRFLLRGGNRAGKFSVAALRGTFRFISGHSAKNAYDIKTTNATIGIRGTAFDFTSGRATLVAVHVGRVNMCAYGKCESIDDHCGVGRAANNHVASARRGGPWPAGRRARLSGACPISLTRAHWRSPSGSIPHPADRSRPYTRTSSVAARKADTERRLKTMAREIMVAMRGGTGDRANAACEASLTGRYRL